MLVLVLIGTVIILWVWSRTNRNKEEPPVCSGSKILIGNALIYAANSVQLWNNIKSVNKEAVERGGVLKTTVGPRVIYVVSNPEDLTTVANACLQKDTVYEFVKRWIEVGLVTSSATALGVDFREKNDVNIEFVKTLSKMFKLIIIRFQSIWLHNNFLFSLSSLKRKQEECIKILHNFSNTILKQRKENLVQDKEKGPRIKLFMDLLLELSRDTNSFTDQEVRQHVDTIIVAGHDTSATVLMYCILLVGSYPRVQKKIHDELKNVFGDEDRDITKQDLSQLIYLEAVIKESMRFYPIVPVIGRHLTEDIKLRNCTLLKGNSVCLLIYGVNRDSMWRPDVEEFRPERWLDPSTLPDSTYTSASFSIGRRSCIGKTYAMMSLKIIMAHFCRNYMVHGDHTKLTLQLDVMLKPVSGHHITLEKRNKIIV